MCTYFFSCTRLVINSDGSFPFVTYSVKSAGQSSAGLPLMNDTMVYLAGDQANAAAPLHHLVVLLVAALSLALATMH